jgi:MFS family permease
MDDPTLREVRRRAATSPAEVQPARSGRKLALVVGINVYEDRDSYTQLENAVNDALVVARRLQDDFDFVVTCLLDEQATAEAIRAWLAHWQADSQPDDDMLVFFAGHGTTERPEDGTTEGYLLPTEAGPDPDSWLPEAEIIERAEAMAAQRVFLVFDACYAGAARRVSEALLPGTREDQVLKILVAGTEKDPVLDGGAGGHSVFTRAFLDSLDGLADISRRPDGVVTGLELIAYVCSEVPWRTRLRSSHTPLAKTGQTPMGGNLQSTPAGDDFHFRPCRPRLPAALLRNIYSPEAEDRIAAAEQLKIRHRTGTEAMAAEELLHLVRNDREPEGVPGLKEEELLRVQRAAIEALGELGHPSGLSLLMNLASGHGVELALSEAAAPALGRLLERSRPAGLPPEDRRDAVEALVAMLSDGRRRLREAAKAGLSRVPGATDRLTQGLAHHDLPMGQVADALACIALAHEDGDPPWPDLAPVPSLLRRYHLLRRRLARPLRALLIHAALVGLAGMLGLGLAFLPAALAAFRHQLGLYVPAILAVCAIPGFFAGVAYAVLPPLSRATSRQPSRRGTLVGALLAGLLFGPFLAVPNWFLGIGCTSLGCPPHAWALFLLPGLVIGPVVGLALAALLHQPPEAAIQPRDLVGHDLGEAPALVAVALAAGLVSALVRLPASLALGSITPAIVEPLLWGLGGALFGLLVAAAWSLPLSPAEGAAPAVAQAWATLAGRPPAGIEMEN